MHIDAFGTDLEESRTETGFVCDHYTTTASGNAAVSYLVNRMLYILAADPGVYASQQGDQSVATPLPCLPSSRQLGSIVRATAPAGMAVGGRRSATLDLVKLANAMGRPIGPNGPPNSS